MKDRKQMKKEGRRKGKSKTEEGHWEGKKDKCKERRIQELSQERR